MSETDVLTEAGSQIKAGSLI